MTKAEKEQLEAAKGSLAGAEQQLAQYDRAMDDNASPAQLKPIFDRLRANVEQAGKQLATALAVE